MVKDVNTYSRNTSMTTASEDIVVAKSEKSPGGSVSLTDRLSRLLRELREPKGRCLLAGAVALLFLALRRLRLHFASGGRFVDTRVAGWLIENGAVWSLCGIRALMPQTRRIRKEDPWHKRARDLLYNIALCLIGGIIVEEGAVGLLHLTSTRLYPHVNYFRPPSRNPNPFTSVGFADWKAGNGRGQLLGAVFQSVIESQLSDESWSDLTTTEFKLPLFLRNFAVFRFFVDIFFYLGHRLMHVYPKIYKEIHKRHHTHFATSLPTNYRFTMTDVLVESAVPIGIGMSVLRACGWKLGRFESNLMVSYISWHESGTHTGKPIPIISIYPPLSPLYNALWNVDGRAIEFHETHHNRIRCNYGITTWIDSLMGTMVMGDKAKEV